MSNALVSEVWLGIKRTIGTAQRQAASATTDYLRLMLKHVPDTLAGQSGSGFAAG
jgi:hypothetical protein